MNKAYRVVVGLGILGLGTLAVMAQPQGKTVMGSEGMLFGAKVSSWAKLNGKGGVQEAGVTIPLAAIEKAPLPTPNTPPPSGEPMMMMPTLSLEFPDVVKKTTFLDHLDLYWEQFGHPPERYLAPHFDFHFFGVSQAQAMAVDCKDLTPPAMEMTPKGYAPAVPPGAKAAEFCVPMMGFHGLPLSEFSAPGQLKPGLFDKVMIAGFYSGKYTFTEPMITREFLLKKQNFSFEVPRPAKVGRKTLYPTVFTATFDAKANAYSFVYSGFEAGE
ncbi:DUF5602 domain-containing protein [Meiothermus granaticius]|uniref:TTHB210-like domain-containing protein n=1 Tax=Meiothermus granaticius NBRC 107808 TaxID=1227551 RepID=A0A399FAN9_9DEIN|nr:DUF5602 domain-containing protein [Meiothermus granaticius]MCL6525601.1 DUF5602 domain-containing protein [Thermaceae bacterium]RIH93707.1 hypothetical protein Mgrana_00290 [Meiothermus granaticius NBRC 107808]GEM85769.1 hypothetical protein MGR01S_03940 [Meiothermus granaticius NBRC 107808]